MNDNNNDDDDDSSPLLIAPLLVEEDRKHCIQQPYITRWLQNVVDGPRKRRSNFIMGADDDDDGHIIAVHSNNRFCSSLCRKLIYLRGFQLLRTTEIPTSSQFSCIYASITAAAQMAAELRHSSSAAAWSSREQHASGAAAHPDGGLLRLAVAYRLPRIPTTFLHAVGAIVLWHTWDPRGPTDKVGRREKERDASSIYLQGERNEAISATEVHLTSVT
jgi:hypothetical protein